MAVDLRFFWIAIAIIGLGVANLFIFGAVTGVVMIAFGLLVLAGSVLFAVFDFAEQFPARRLDKRVAHRSESCSRDGRGDN